MLKRALSAAVLAFVAITALPVASASASTQDFTFDSYSADYYLGLDSEGRSTLKTVETLVAEFPAIDQNHGILRAIPTSYDGHPVDLHVDSVTDENGNKRPFREANDDEKKDVDGFYQLVSRDPNFVHGKQTYVITYTEHNVTRHFADEGNDQFYWDTNGTGWAQPFGSVTARLHVSRALASAFDHTKACYQGYDGSKTPCDLVETTEANGGLLFTSTATNLLAEQNMTIAIGFTPGVIVARDSSFFASDVWGGLIFFALLALAVFIWVVVIRMTRLRDARGRIAVIAQYTPPPGYDLIADAIFLKQTSRASAAQIVDLAVRGNLRIIEGEGGFFNRREYTLEFVSDAGLQSSEAEFASVFFGSLTPGAQYTIRKNDTARGRAVYAVVQSVKSAFEPHVYAKIPLRSRAVPVLVGLLSLVGTIVCALIMIGDARGGGVPWAIGGAVLLFAIVGAALLFRRPLNSAGAELRDDLEGLRLYIRLAEADRLRMLQSPTGAERTQVSTSDPREILKINEKLLPYAVLFHLEQEWAAELGKYYDDSPPTWYAGSGAFNAALFASSIGGFSSSTSSSFSGSAASSSSGGSGGGGSSGGGGGGGGGGGV